MTECRICAGDMTYRWTLPIYHDRYEADYFQCRSCQSLQVESPVWLAESYAEVNSFEYHALEDGASRQRNGLVRDWMRCLDLKGGRVLDFGSGTGTLKRLLKDFTVDDYDPHYGASNVKGPYDIVVCCDVLEHLVDPIGEGEFIKEMAPDGLVLVKTPVYVPWLHTRDWWLLAREYGQHVTMWTEQSLSYFRDRFKFKMLWLPV